MRKFNHFLPLLALLPIAAAPAWCQNVQADNAAPGTYLESSDQPQAQSQLTIAIADFAGTEPSTGKFIAETLLSDLSQSRQLQFVERSALKQALNELKLQDSGLVDPEKAKELGRLVSADSMIVGSYYEQAGEIVLNARLVDLATGRVVVGSGANATGDSANLLPVVHQLAHLLHQNITGRDFAISGEVSGAKAPPHGDTSRRVPYHTTDDDTADSGSSQYLVPDAGAPTPPPAPYIDQSLFAPYTAYPVYSAGPSYYGPFVGVGLSVGPTRGYSGGPVGPGYRAYPRLNIGRPLAFASRPHFRAGYGGRGRLGRGSRGRR
jgi:TolB-like protein